MEAQDIVNETFAKIWYRRGELSFPIHAYLIRAIQNGCLNYLRSLHSRERIIDEYREALDKGEYVANSLVQQPNEELYVDWSPYLGHELKDDWDTSVDIEKLKAYGRRMAEMPEGFKLQRQVQKVVEQRLAMQTGEEPLNWGAAETLAYASLVDEDFLVRITGEDVGRDREREKAGLGPG